MPEAQLQRRRKPNRETREKTRKMGRVESWHSRLANGRQRGNRETRERTRKGNESRS